MKRDSWEIVDTRLEQCGGMFRVRIDSVIMPRNKKRYNVYALQLSDWVNIVALTPQGEVVMVRQYRHGIRDFTLEFPGGVIDLGDTPEEAALRELREETGYEVEEILPVGMVYPNPAIQTNRCFTFLGRNAKQIYEQELDELEDIEVVTVPAGKIAEMIRDGRINHGLIVSAFGLCVARYPELFAL